MINIVRKLDTRIHWAVGGISALFSIYYMIIRWYLPSSNAVDTGTSWLLYSNSPLYYMILGLIIVVISAFKYSRKLIVSTIAGYCAGFIFAVLFNSDSPDPTGAMVYNNAWSVWIIVYFIFIIAGVIWANYRQILEKIKLYKNSTTLY